MTVKLYIITSSEEFAIDSYKVNAFNYILKPVEKDELFSTLDSAIEAISKRKYKYILVKTKESSVKINFDNIMYAELSKRAVIYHLTNGKTVKSTSIRTNFSDTVRELLCDSRFISCGASMVANMHHISEVENEAIIFNETHKIHLSVKTCRDIRSAWCEFCLSEVRSI